MVTIKDIAKIAGVSHTTVSRALNNNPLIKLDTRLRIQKIAKELNYVPNISAKSLVNQKKYMIGLFLSSIDQGTSSSFLADTITGIHSALDPNYSLSVEGIDELGSLENINFQRYDGILIMSQSESDNQFIQHLKGQKVPFAVLNRHISDEELLNIVADDLNGVTYGIEYAIKSGHSSIAYIGGKENFESANIRRDAVIDCLNKHQLPVRQEFFYSGDYSLESGFQKMKELLQVKELPTFVFCANDDMAIGAMRAIDDAGLKVPEDLSIIGFDNTPLAAYLNPPLTTIDKPLKEISKMGTELLLQQIEGNFSKTKRFEISTSLVIRESVRQLH